jgi:hypothetical protein
MMIMLCRTSLFVIGILFYVSSSTTAEQSAGGDMSKLSIEVISAMEGNQATLDSIRTLQATLTKNSTHSFPDKKGYQLLEKYRIIYDGDHFRKDQLETKLTGGKEYRKYAEALRVGQIDIDSAESGIDYIPSNDMVFIRPPRWNNNYKIRTNDLLKYQSARGATLKENIQASARNGYYFTARSEAVDGDDCVLLTCDYANPESTLKIWVVPSKGYCIKKMQDGSKSKVDDEYTTILKEYSPGMWWFESVRARKTFSLETVVSQLSVNSLTFNEPVAQGVFTVWGMDISSKTKIRDEMQDKMYTLAIDDAKDTVANTTGSAGKILVLGLGILALAAVVFLGTFIRGRRVHR